MISPLNFIKKFIKSSNQKELDRLQKIVNKINSLEQNLKSLKVRDINHLNPKVKFNLSKYYKKKDTIF